VNTESREVRGQVAAPVRSVLRWMRGLRDDAGRIVCPDHGVVHSGKNAGAIVMACELARHDPRADRDDLLAFAVEQAQHLVDCLEREGESTCFTFRPGRHDPYNCSNSVIDGGACSDALAEVVRTFGPRLDARQRESFQNASVLHAQTYLRYCVFDKGVPAQRAWAMTGVAGAWDLARHDVLELTVLEGAEVLAGVQHGDGSYPYHPAEWGAGHVGASDVSSFYQSRVTAFLLFALERIGRDPTDPRFSPQLTAGLEFLLGLAGPDGIKCGLVEAKPWYWGADYEVASHPFDVYALARGWRHFEDPRLARAARSSFEAWAAHLSPEGRPTSHRPGPGRSRSYQCPLFWAGHASWMARAMGDLDAILDLPVGEDTGRQVVHFPDADLVRLEDERVCAWVRGRRPGFNVHHGSPHGAGLVRAIAKPGGEALVVRGLPGAAIEGEWRGRLGWPSPGRGRRGGGEELRFSLWMARNAWRGGRRREALMTPLRTFKRGVLAFGGPRIGSPYALDPELEVLPDGVFLTGRLARRDGTPVEGSRLERSFRLTGEGLEVEERLLAAGRAKGLTYLVPTRARDLVRDGSHIRYRLA
jgi:hypothetical protein